VDKDEDMDVDAVDNDFIPGCAILDIGNVAPGAVITGQPGIGEFSLSIRNTLTHIDVQREKRLGILCLVPTSRRKEAGHLVSRPLFAFCF